MRTSQTVRSKPCKIRPDANKPNGEVTALNEKIF